MVAQIENNRHCSAVRKRERTVACRSASRSLSPVKWRPRRKVVFHFKGATAWTRATLIFTLIDTNPSHGSFSETCRNGSENAVQMWVITFSPRLSLVAVQDQAVPGGAEHGTQLRDGEGVCVLAYCGDTHKRWRWDEGMKSWAPSAEMKASSHHWVFSEWRNISSLKGQVCIIWRFWRRKQRSQTCISCLPSSLLVCLKIQAVTLIIKLDFPNLLSH